MLLTTLSQHKHETHTIITWACRQLESCRCECCSCLVRPVAIAAAIDYMLLESHWIELSIFTAELGFRLLRSQCQCVLSHTSLATLQEVRICTACSILPVLLEPQKHRSLSSSGYMAIGTSPGTTGMPKPQHHQLTVRTVRTRS